MLFFVQTIIGVTSRAILKRESERRLYFATDRFQTHIREIDVVLRDVNGPRGGVDKLCRITARLRHGGSLAIEEKSTSFITAIRAAARRLRCLLTRRIG